MKKIWVVIIATVFSILVIGGMGNSDTDFTDYDSIIPEDNRTFTISESDLKNITFNDDDHHFDSGFLFTRYGNYKECYNFDEFKMRYFYTDDVVLAEFSYYDRKVPHLTWHVIIDSE